MITKYYRQRSIVLASCFVSALTAMAATEFEQNLDKTFPVSAGGKLVIEADRGSVTISTDGAAEAKISVLRKIKGASKVQADEMFADHDVKFEQNGSTVSVTAKNKKQKSGFWNNRAPQMEVHYQVTIPKKFDVELTTAGGDIAMGELDGSAATRTTSGHIQLKSVTGKVEAANAGGDISLVEGGKSVTARTTSGSIKIHSAKGALEVSNAGGDIQIGDGGAGATCVTTSGSIDIGSVQGAADLRNAGGNIRIATAGGNLMAQTTSGSIKVQTAKGKSTSLKDAGGDIEVAQADGNLAAQTSSGSIRIKTAKGRVEAKNAGGDISIGEAGGELTAGTTSGSIKIGAARSKATLRNAGGNISVAQAAAAVTAQTTSGEISVAFQTAPTAESTLSVAGGGIKVSVPKDAAINLDAKASGGRVVADSIVVEGVKKEGLISGKINGGGPVLTLRTSSGDIRMKATTGALAAEREEGK